MPPHRFLISIAAFIPALWILAAAPFVDNDASRQAPDSFHFVLLGDRTGETVPGVYSRVWKDATATNPAFVLSVGDTIQGADDATAERQWDEIQKMLAAWKRFPLYLAPGNHDIWSARSEELFRKYSDHATHYGFDYGNAHFTVLDNSRTDELSGAELDFLEQDLEQHRTRSPKFIVSHRPSWIVKAIIGDPNFRLHQLARKYGANYVIAGHIHDMLHAELENIDYISMASAGGHLRASGKYDDGWFFGWAAVDVSANRAAFQIHELAAPYGQGRSSTLHDWGPAGLHRAQ